MKKKGFTLIELLAVIVIISTILVITVPKILNVIENSQKQASIDSAYGYIKSINYENSLNDVDNSDYSLIEDGEDINVSKISSKIKIKGTLPTLGKVTIKNKKVISADLCINDYHVKYDESNMTAIKNCTESEFKKNGRVKLSSYYGKYTYPETGTVDIIENKSNGKLSCSTNDAKIATCSIDNNVVTIVSGKKEGNTTLTIKSEANEEYNEAKAAYEVITSNGLLSITAEGYEGTYDGKEHGITVISSGATIKYGTSLGEYNLTESPKYINPGTYTVYYEVTKEGYKTVNGSKDIIINKAKFLVTFNANSGSTATNNKTITYNEEYGTLPVPTRSGYRFDGWYTSASGGNLISANTIVTTFSNHTLYAHWTQYVAKNVTGGVTIYYTDLQSAFNNASTTTITLLTNVTSNISVSNLVNNLVFNLNQKTLTGSISNNNSSSNITIQNGTIINSSNNVIYNKGTLSLQSGTIQTTSTSTSVRAINNLGILNINGGTIISPAGWTVKNTGKITMTGGTIKQTLAGSTGTALYNDTNGTVYATGGNIKSTAYGFVNNSKAGTNSNQATLMNMNISITYAGGFANVYNINNSYTITKNCTFSTAASNAIFNNGSGLLVDYYSKTLQSKPVIGVVYTLIQWPNGDIQVTVFGRNDITSLPTWSIANGQDDIQWYSPSTYTDVQGTYQYIRFSKSNHGNVSGEYATHVYAGNTFLYGFSYIIQ